MALSAFFLVGTEHEDTKVRRAGWVYLVATHTGTLLLTALVILLSMRSGGLLWLPIAGPASPLFDLAILILALLGFGFKAGWIPFHFWLPAAHASAPSHVSAMLSAVMLKAGIYGILRVSRLLPAIPVGLGGAVLAVGAATALYGVFYAVAERDFKRLLAYSSIENLGVIAMGIGLGLTGRAAHDPLLTALGFGSALLHVWNHSVFKTLLFFGAGSVLHATKTRDMEVLGGLAARMPLTARVLFPGVLAVAAMPPFGTFISEWILYRGLFTALMRGYPWTAGIALPALAIVGGLAILAFAKFFGFLFLGSPRSEAAKQAHDPHPAMLIPMGILAILCLALCLDSAWLLPLLDRVVATLAPEGSSLLAQSVGGEIAIMSGVLSLLLLFAVAAWAWVRRAARPAPAIAPPTWDCGYAAPAVRMQYSADSFTDGWARLLPGRQARIRRLKSIFPRAAALRLELRDSIGLGFLEPQFERLTARALRLRRLQPGFLSVYLLYVLLALLSVFLWMLARQWLLG
jgi:hydrogenase-4 component B